VRTFESPQMFLDNYARISGDNTAPATGRDGKEKKSLGASVPSLGLSNKPIECQDGEEFSAWSNVKEEERHVKDKFPDFYFNPEDHEKPPPEETLVQNTLWPEIRKLYGHGNEIYCLTATTSVNGHEGQKGGLLASACRASKADQADVILWSTNDDWNIVQRLQGHSLTVTQMAFSPCGRRLLTVSRDRTWCLFENSLEGQWSLLGKTDKSNSVHQRLLWCCSWSQDSKFFATGSRDKKVAVWTVDGDESPEADGPSKDRGSLGRCRLACRAPLSLDSPVTALAFIPSHSSGEERLLMAVGLESGKIAFVQWSPLASANGETGEEWRVLETLDCDRAHHKAVKRLKVRPRVTSMTLNGGQVATLASCSDDHFVKIHNVWIK